MLADRPDHRRIRPVCATIPGVDFDAAGLLDGLEGEDRAARERLLHRLVDEGYTLEELKQAVKEDRLPLLLVERVLGRPLHGQASSRSGRASRPRRCCGSGACSASPRPPRTTACSARRR